MSVENRKSGSVDAVQLGRSLGIGFAFIAAVVSAGYALASGKTVFMLGIVALPFLFMLMSRPDGAFVIAFILSATGMAIPGVSYTTLGLPMQVIVIASSLLLFVFYHGSSNNDRRMPESKPLKWLVAIIFILMIVRGTGLRMFGSSTWGGMAYVVMLLNIFFFFAVQNVRLSKKQIYFLLWGMLLAGLIGSQFDRIGWESSTRAASETVRTRISWLLAAVYAAFPLVFVLRLSKWIKLLLWLGLIFLVGLTGFRSRLVELLMITVAFGFFTSRKRLYYVFRCITLGIVFWGGILLASPHMPLGLQRTVSFIPGVQVAEAAAENAKGSIEWRLEIWRYCLQQSDNYLFLGRGSAFDVKDTAAGLGLNDVATYSPWFAFQTRSYHSGPLSLLIDYGIPGFLVGTWLCVILFGRFWRYANRLGKNDTFESRFALYSCSYMLWQIVAFYLVYGSMVKFSNTILAMSSFALVLSNSYFYRNEPEFAELQNKSLSSESNIFAGANV